MLVRFQQYTGHAAAIYDLRPAPGGFYSAAADGYVVRWSRDEPEMGRVVARVEGGKFYTLAALPGGGFVAGAVDGGVHWLYPESPERNRHVAHHRRSVYAVRYFAEHVFTAGGDGVLSRWNPATGRLAESLPLSANSLRCIAYHPDTNTLAVGASDGRVYLVDRPSFTLRGSFPANQPSVFCAAFRPTTAGRVLLTGGRDAQLRQTQLTDAGTGAGGQTATPAHLATVNALAFHPGGAYFATASRDKTLKLWEFDGDSPRLLKVCEIIRDRGHVNSVNTLLWLDETTLISAGDDRRVLAWRLG